MGFARCGSSWAASAVAEIEAAARGGSFLVSLLLYLRAPVTLEEARATLRRRLANREADFLRNVGRLVYGHRASPYRRLLRHAGCEYGDLEQLLRKRGLEGALATLFRQGVYLTGSELRGDRPVVRGSLRFDLRLRHLRAPWRVIPSPIVGRRAWPVPQHLAMFQDLAVNAVLTTDARGGAGWRHGHWSSPSDSSVLWLLRATGPGYRPVRWFSRFDPAVTPIAFRRRVIAKLVPWLTARAGVPLPPPTPAPYLAPRPILDWLSEELAAGHTPALSSPVGLAVSLSREARRAGQDLRGAQLTISAEPATPARVQEIKAAGLKPVVAYGTRESGLIAHGCLEPSAADDMHLYHDAFAVVRVAASEATAELPAGALLLTGLQPSWPYTLLNVSLGDQATMTRRDCGCAMGALGWPWHLDTVRSFEKIKVGAAPVPVSAIERLVEEVLPAQCGGSAIDYQLYEADDEMVHGQARLRLLIAPSVGEIDEQRARALALAALRRGGATTADLEADPDWLTIARRLPVVSAGGKIYHVHRASWSTEPK